MPTIAPSCSGQMCIKLNDVSFSYNSVPVLEHITLSIQYGEFIGIIGPNGGGKSTLVKCIVGLLTPTEGSIEIFGNKQVTQSAQKKIGYVPQRSESQSGSFPFTVGEIVDMGLAVKSSLFSFHHHDEKEIRKALKDVGMETHREEKMSNLSGGQKQRVLIARALVGNPTILILDEPTVGVDEESKEDFFALLKSLNTRKNITILLISHDTDAISKEVHSMVSINRTLSLIADS
ncbi:metal ABC transporter ATP-binding protein [Candidatus Gottesmanbacteria bacterium]|nr:metal ABC transporter ATP-binding protein [Candidatus Gottesmanbacteria bacterium]